MSGAGKHKLDAMGLSDDEMTEDTGPTQQGSGTSSKRKIRRWTEAEHDSLVQLVAKLGEDACWATIAEHIPGRTGKQCRERWVNHIGADIKKGGWTAEEEARMAHLHANMGPAWTRIAAALGNRTENSVKNHFNALLRSKRLDDKHTSVLAQYVKFVRDRTVTGMAAYDAAVTAATEAANTACGSLTCSQPSTSKLTKTTSLSSQGDAKTTGKQMRAAPSLTATLSGSIPAARAHPIARTKSVSAGNHRGSAAGVAIGTPHSSHVLMDALGAALTHGPRPFLDHASNLDVGRGNDNGAAQSSHGGHTDQHAGPVSGRRQASVLSAAAAGSSRHPQSSGGRPQGSTGSGKGSLSSKRSQKQAGSGAGGSVSRGSRMQKGEPSVAGAAELTVWPGNGTTLCTPEQRELLSQLHVSLAGLQSVKPPEPGLPASNFPASMMMSVPAPDSHAWTLAQPPPYIPLAPQAGGHLPVAMDQQGTGQQAPLTTSSQRLTHATWQHNGAVHAGANIMGGGILPMPSSDVLTPGLGAPTMSHLPLAASWLPGDLFSGPSRILTTPPTAPAPVVQHALSLPPHMPTPHAGAADPSKGEIEVPEMADLSFPEPGGASNASLSLAMQELAGHTSFTSVFGIQNNVELSSPPASPRAQVRANGVTSGGGAALGAMNVSLGGALFSNLLPSAMSQDVFAANLTQPQQNTPVSQHSIPNELLLGQVSGFSLEAMLAGSPLTAQGPSASHLYFAQGRPVTGGGGAGGELPAGQASITLGMLSASTGGSLDFRFDRSGQSTLGGMHPSDWLAANTSVAGSTERLTPANVARSGGAAAGAQGLTSNGGMAPSGNTIGDMFATWNAEPPSVLAGQQQRRDTKDAQTASSLPAPGMVSLQAMTGVEPATDRGVFVGAGGPLRSMDVPSAETMGCLDIVFEEARSGAFSSGGVISGGMLGRGPSFSGLPVNGLDAAVRQLRSSGGGGGVGMGHPFSSRLHQAAPEPIQLTPPMLQGAVNGTGPDTPHLQPSAQAQGPVQAGQAMGVGSMELNQVGLTNWKPNNHRKRAWVADDGGELSNAKRAALDAALNGGDVAVRPRSMVVTTAAGKWGQQASLPGVQLPAVASLKAMMTEQLSAESSGTPHGLMGSSAHSSPQLVSGNVGVVHHSVSRLGSHHHALHPSPAAMSTW